MKERPFTHQFGDIFAFKCPTTCPFFGGTRGKARSFCDSESCLTGLTIGEVKNFVQDALGLRESEASSTSEQTDRLLSLIWGCWAKDGFDFEVGRHKVCESTVAYLLGYMTMDDGVLGSRSGGWKCAKKRVFEARSQGIDLLQLQNEDLRLATTSG